MTLPRPWTGVAAIAAGALLFVGQAGELVHHSPTALWAGMGIGGFVALVVAVWGLRDLVGSSRPGRIGIRLSLVGVAFLGLFAVHLGVELIRTGDVPGNFILFLLGFLFLLVGQLLFARDLRAAIGSAWVFPIVGVVGLVLALFLNSVGLHDIGLFIFEGAWVGLGVALLRAERQRAPERSPAPD
jgi:hypothetical protein